MDRSVMLLEAREGSRFLVRVIRAGLSGNGVFYPDAVLREALPLFSGARVMVKGDSEHLLGGGKDPRNIIGRLVQASMVEGQLPDTGEVQAELEVLQSAGDIASRLTEAVNRGMAGLYGLSINAVGRVEPSVVSGKQARRATRIDRVDSVDLIVEPGAGGEVIRLIEAQAPDPNTVKGAETMKDFLVGQIRRRAPDLLSGVDDVGLDEARIEALFREAFPEPAQGRDPPAADQGATAPGVATPPAETAPVPPDAIGQMIEARWSLREALAESGLPKAAQGRVAGRVQGIGAFVAADVDREIAAERTYLGQVTTQGRVTGLGGVSVQLVESRRQKSDQMLDVLLGTVASAGNGGMVSLREAYGQMTGDHRVTGRLDRADHSLMREALDSASWGEVLGSALTRRLLADYRTTTVYDVWRQLATITPIGDFRTQERTRFGGYGDLPVVNEGSAYLAVTSPGDEKATYAAAKRGGIESVTLEMVRNDDVGAVRQLPVKLSRAAKRTLGKFVLDFLRTNPTIYDTKTLFHADHGNLGSTALSLVSWGAARLAMLAQAEAGSLDPLGIAPTRLWVPPALESAASDLFRRNTNLEPTFLQSTAPGIVSVWYWTDANDWCASCDPLDIPSIEIGFLDGNQEPELFTQDAPTAGSVFTNDQITYKIRHVYGGAVTDYRGLYKAVVA